ncbi:MAG: restriction endonuclease subunit S [Candidatus Kuenenia sp.]|nr:restriction endonuclease subunit S [Candidatus Kuenenia hertensis]
MSAIGKKERETQNQVVALLRKEPGYRYPGNWEEREGNSSIEKQTRIAQILSDMGAEIDSLEKKLEKYPGGFRSVT